MVDPKLRANLTDALKQAHVRARFHAVLLSCLNWGISMATGHRGGREPGETIPRDIQMAREYEQRRPTSYLSPTALKIDIGRKHDLKRSAAIDAIDRGLKKLSG